MITLRLDASALKESACGFKFKSIVIDGWRDPITYNDTHYGTCVHRFIALMHETGGNFQEAVIQTQNLWNSKKLVVRGKKSHLTVNHLVKTCIDYWQEYELKSDFELLINPSARCWKCSGFGNVQEGDMKVSCPICNGTGTRSQPMVEQKFEIPFYKTPEVEILICGTMDKIGKIRNGCYAIGDNKVTSSWDTEAYLRPYRLSPQLMLYVWALKRLAAEADEGSVLKEVTRFPVGAFIDGVFIKSGKETSFVRSEVFIFKDWELEQFEEMLYRKCDELLEMIRTDRAFKTGKIEGLCSTFNLPCKFFDVCSAPTEEVGQLLLKKNFVQKPYNPLMFGLEE